LFVYSGTKKIRIWRMVMKKMVLVVSVVLLAVVNFAMADTFGTGANEFTIDFVDISGDASSTNGTAISGGSPSDSYYRTFTDPTHDYRMGIYEITNDQWNKFQSSYGTVIGSPSTAYDQSPTFTGTSVPTTNVSWYEAAQFVNYLNTSTGHQAAYKFSGSQSTSGYTLELWSPGDTGYDASNPFRNSNAHYFMPTEDEWVKAAYWNGTSLQTYANASPDDLLFSVTPDPTKWNYDTSAGNEPWNIGSGSEELNGTFDMMGNIGEWMESPFYSGEHLSGSLRTFLGGSYDGSYITLRSSFRNGNLGPSAELNSVGFRVASVPEPCSIVLLSIGALSLLRKRKS